MARGSEGDYRGIAGDRDGSVRGRGHRFLAAQFMWPARAGRAPGRNPSDSHSPEVSGLWRSAAIYPSLVDAAVQLMRIGEFSDRPAIVVGLLRAFMAAYEAQAQVNQAEEPTAVEAECARARM